MTEMSLEHRGRNHYDRERQITCPAPVSVKKLTGSNREECGCQGPVSRWDMRCPTTELLSSNLKYLDCATSPKPCCGAIASVPTISRKTVWSGPSLTGMESGRKKIFGVGSTRSFATDERLRRRRSVHVRLSEVGEGELPVSDGGPYAALQYRDFLRAFRELPEEQRSVLFLAAVEDLSYREVSRSRRADRDRHVTAVACPGAAPPHHGRRRSHRGCRAVERDDKRRITETSSGVLPVHADPVVAPSTMCLTPDRSCRQHRAAAKSSRGCPADGNAPWGSSIGYGRSHADCRIAGSGPPLPF